MLILFTLALVALYTLALYFLLRPLLGDAPPRRASRSAARGAASLLLLSTVTGCLALLFALPAFLTAILAFLVAVPIPVWITLTGILAAGGIALWWKASKRSTAEKRAALLALADAMEGVCQVLRLVAPYTPTTADDKALLYLEELQRQAREAASGKPVNAPDAPTVRIATAWATADAQRNLAAVLNGPKPMPSSPEV